MITILQHFQLCKTKQSRWRHNKFGVDNAVADAADHHSYDGNIAIDAEDDADADSNDANANVGSK